MTEKTNGNDPMRSQIIANGDAAIKEALALADAADAAAEKMVADCEKMLTIVKGGTSEVRQVLREKMVEFSTLMRDYSEKIAEQNATYIETMQRAIEMVESNLRAVNEAAKVLAKPRPDVGNPKALSSSLGIVPER